MASVSAWTAWRAARSRALMRPSQFSIVTTSSPGVPTCRRYVISISINGDTCIAFSCRLSSTWSAFPPPAAT